MGIGPIQFGGLATGLDTNAIISALLQVESLPIQQLQSQKSANQQKISLLGTLEGLLKKLSDQAQDIATLAGITSQKVEVADETVAGVEITGSSATPGGHSLTVNALASADVHTISAAAGIGDPDAALSDGDLSFDVGGASYQVTVAAGDTLADVASKINAAAGEDVTASVINVGAQESPSYQLVLSSKETGTANAITGLATDVAELDTISNVSAASNAQIVLDGITIQRSTNDFDDVLAGVSIQALSAGESTSFTVSVDTDGIKEKLQAFVDAFNAVAKFVNDQNAFDSEAEEGEDATGGPLFGDSILSTVRARLNTALFDVDIAAVQADTAGFSTLGLVGIEVQDDGTLMLDETKVDEKMTEDLDAFLDLFADVDGTSGEDTGIAGTIADAIDSLLDSSQSVNGDTLPGLLDARTDALKTNNKTIDNRISTLEYQLGQKELFLVQKFAALEELVSGLNAQGSFLTQNLANLGSLNKN